MSFYQLPNPWNPGFVIPEYVMAEPPERGTFTTAWMPRGTIPALVPDYLAKPGRKILGRNNAELGSLAGSCFAGNSLGDDATAEPIPMVQATAVVAPAAPAMSTGKKVAIVAGVLVAAHVLFGKKRR